MEKRIEEQPGTNTREPAEGTRTDAQGPSEQTRGGQPERPGTKTSPPVEGADERESTQRTVGPQRG